MTCVVAAEAGEPEAVAVVGGDQRGDGGAVAEVVVALEDLRDVVPLDAPEAVDLALEIGHLATPVSITPTTTWGSPVVKSSARSTCVERNAHSYGRFVMPSTSRE